MTGRFHYLYAVRCLRYGFLLCLIPLVRALVAFRIDYFFEALRQDAFILALMAFLSIYYWLATRFILRGDLLEVRTGVLLQRYERIHTDDLAACELRRPFFMRLLGAAELELFLRTKRPIKSVRLLLPYKQAAALQDAIFPVQKQNVVFRPSGSQKLLLVAFSTNLITETALILYTVDRVDKFLGGDFSSLALSRFERVLDAISALLPAGFTLLTSFVLFFTLCSLFISMLRTGGYCVARAGDAILCRGGIYTRVEQRIRARYIQAIDVRLTPMSRLTGYYSVYLSAGGFSNSNTPILFFKRKDPAVALALFPTLVLPHALPRYKHRSLGQYLAVHGPILGVFVFFWILAARVVPGAVPVFAIFSGIWLVLVLVQLEAFFFEGWQDAGGGRLYCLSERRFTRHHITLFLKGCAFCERSSTSSLLEDRTTLVVRTPAGAKRVVRGVQKSTLDAFIQSLPASPET